MVVVRCDPNELTSVASTLNHCAVTTSQIGSGLTGCIHCALPPGLAAQVGQVLAEADRVLESVLTQLIADVNDLLNRASRASADAASVGAVGSPLTGAGTIGGVGFSVGSVGAYTFGDGMVGGSTFAGNITPSGFTTAGTVGGAGRPMGGFSGPGGTNPGATIRSGGSPGRPSSSPAYTSDGLPFMANLPTAADAIANTGNLGITSSLGPGYGSSIRMRPGQGRWW